jgi:hypothetical protein
MEHLERVHWSTPKPNAAPVYEPEPFRTPAPTEPSIEHPTWEERWITSKRKAKLAADDQLRAAYKSSYRAWEASKAAHEPTQNQKRKEFDEGIRTSAPKALQALLMEAQSEKWSFPFAIDASGDEQFHWVYLKVDLPEIEDFPINSADVVRGKLKWRPLSLKQRRGLYVKYIHGLVFKLIGLGFACVPNTKEVILVAYTQRPLLTPGSQYDAYILSVRVKREEWEQVRFDTIQAVNPINELERFDLRRDLDKRKADLHSITPHPKPSDDAPSELPSR